MKPRSISPGFSALGGGRSKRKHVAAAVEVAAVEDQDAVAVVDARARLGRRDEAAQHRRHALGIDREFDAGLRVLRRPVALAGLQLQETVGIDGDGVGVDGGGGRDGAGDDLALHQEALHARVDQPGAELREIEHAGDQRDQPREIEDDDAAGEAGKALRDEEGPGRAQRLAQRGEALMLLRARRLRTGLFCFGARRLDFNGSIEHVKSQSGCLAH